MIVQEALSLAETVCDDYIRGKATVRHRDIYWLVSSGLLQEFVTQPLGSVVNQRLQFADGRFGKEAAERRAAVPVKVVILCSEDRLPIVSLGKWTRQRCTPADLRHVSH